MAAGFVAGRSVAVAPGSSVPSLSVPSSDAAGSFAGGSVLSSVSPGDAAAVRSAAGGLDVGLSGPDGVGGA